jgi:hypothetical protein
MRPLIISLAVNGRDNYIEIQKKLIDTLHLAGDCDTWILNEYPEGVTSQKEIPYKFKYDLIKQAYEKGYTKIFWLDSTMRLVKNPFDLLEISDSGIVAFDNLGHPTYKYITDLAVDNLKCNDYIYDVANTWGGALGFDFEKPLAKIILDEILHQAEIGSFNNGTSTREGFVAARHDQSVNSVIFHNHNIEIFVYGFIASKRDLTEKTYIQYGD